MKRPISIFLIFAALMFAAHCEAWAVPPKVIRVPDTMISVVTADLTTTGVAVNPSTNRLYVSVGEGNYGNNGAVWVLDITSGASNVLDEIPIGQDSWNVAVDTVNNKLYVVNLQGNVSVVDIVNDANTVITNIPVGSGPRDIAINELRQRAYVANANSHDITVINTTNNTVINTIPNVGFPVGIALNPATERLYVPTFGDDVLVFDTTNDQNQFLDTITIPEIAGQSSSTIDVAVNTQMNRLYVSSSGSGPPPVIERLTAVDISNDNNQVIGNPLPVGAQGGGGIREIAIDETMDRVYVSNVLDGTVSVINTVNDSLTLEKTIPVDPGTYRITIDRQSGNLYGTASGPSFRFAVLADSRSAACNPIDGNYDSFKQCVNWEVLQPVFAKIKDFAPDFVFFTGDMARGNKSSTLVEQELEAWQIIINEPIAAGSNYAQEKVLPVFGGHERNLDVGQPVWKAFSDVFDPKNQETVAELSCDYFDVNEIPLGHPDRQACLTAGADYGHTVYSCDFRNQARFFVLNNDCDPFLNTGGNCEVTGDYGSEVGPCQRAWLSSKIQEKPLNFLFHHEPAYGTGAHGSQANPRNFTMDQKKDPRNDYINLIANNATMIFSGHEHQYTRRLVNHDFATLPINLETHLALFVVSGGADGPRRAWSFEGAQNQGDPNKAPVLHIEWTTNYQSGTYEQPIADGKDDAEESFDGSISILSSDLELMKDGTDVQTAVGMRWVDLAIPRDANIDTAYIQFTADDEGIQANPATVEICGEDAGIARKFTTQVNSLSERVDAGNCVLWANIPAWNSNEKLPAQRADVTNIIQNIVNRPDWGGQINLSRSFMELKTGCVGAPWKENTDIRYRDSLERECSMVDNDTYWYWSPSATNKLPYHFAIVDVAAPPGDSLVRVAVYALTKDGGFVLIDRHPDSGLVEHVPCDGCIGVRDLSIVNQTLSTNQTLEACRSITAGPAVNVTSTGYVTFQAGKRVILKSGFSVEDGGVLSVIIDPTTGRLP